MDNQLNENLKFVVEKIETAIGTLASKLLITVDHLYQVLLRQVQLESYVNLVTSISAFILMIVGLIFSFKTYNLGKENDWDYESPLGGKFLFSALIFVASCITSFVNFHSYIMKTFNPEYVVFLRITKLISGL